MRVIRINAVFGSASTGRTAEQLDRGLKKYGVDSTTVCSVCRDGASAVRMGSDSDVKLHSLMARLVGNAGYYSKKPTKELIKYLDAQKPDIVHLHNLHGNFISLPILFDYLAQRRIPTVVTLHDCWWYTGKCCHYTADGCYKWQEACGSCPRLKKDIPSWFFDRSAAMLSDKKKWFASLSKYAVIGVSDWIANEAGKSFMKDAAFIERVYNWVDTELFSPVESDIRKRYGLEDKYVILGVSGKWSEAKGYSQLLELARRLPDDARLVLIGALPEGETPELVVSIPATESQRELAQWYSAADVFVNLSMEESFGKVTAEALSCGTPVIAVDSTANPELVGPGCGIVIGSANADEALNAALAIREKGKGCYSAACRGFALENFEMESNIKAVYGVYQKLLEV